MFARFRGPKTTVGLMMTRSLNPNNYYGASKLKAEAAIAEWTQKDADRKAVIIRPTVVFGPRNRANIFRLVKQVCDDNFIWVGHGSNIKSIAYVENLVDATIFLLAKMEAGLSVLNYADTPHMETKEIVSLIAHKAGVQYQSVQFQDH